MARAQATNLRATSEPPRLHLDNSGHISANLGEFRRALHARRRRVAVTVWRAAAELAARAASAQLRDQHRREFEAVSHRAGDVERELRRTLASTEQRHAGCTHATVGTV